MLSGCEEGMLTREHLVFRSSLAAMNGSRCFGISVGESQTKSDGKWGFYHHLGGITAHGWCGALECGTVVSHFNLLEVLTALRQ